MFRMYREMSIDEAQKIAEIDATNFIKNVWRMNPEKGEYELVEINWTDNELPNGYDWHLRRFREKLESGGAAFACYENNVIVGYATLDGKMFGKNARYVLLDQLFVSKEYRGKGIGKGLFMLCARKARDLGAEKLYLCAGSSEDTIAFYKKCGCQKAVEINMELFKEDPKDIQLEYMLDKL